MWQRFRSAASYFVKSSQKVQLNVQNGNFAKCFRRGDTYIYIKKLKYVYLCSVRCKSVSSKYVNTVVLSKHCSVFLRTHTNPSEQQWRNTTLKECPENLFEKSLFLQSHLAQKLHWKHIPSTQKQWHMTYFHHLFNRNKCFSLIDSY